MESFVARQPIFDRQQRVYGYELLYRDGFDNAYNSQIDGDKATVDVLNSSFMVIGICEITDGKKAFINFTTNLLKQQVATVFDSDIVVVEILEDVKVNKEVITACKYIKEQGYILALDDFVFSDEYLPLLKLADIIKVDFLNSTQQERKKIVDVATEMDIKLLAEKVETREEFQTALDLGYSYFQGYFFSKPKIIQGSDLPVYTVNYLQILEEISKKDVDINKVAEAIGRDVSLSYKILKLINSAAFGVRNKVTSVKNALMLLGLKEVKKLLNIIVIRETANSKETEIIRLALIRAKFCETVAEMINGENKEEYFMMGLFSLMDVLLNKEMKQALEQLPISNEIKFGLLGYRGLMNDVYELVLAYEKANWSKFSQKCIAIDLTERELANSYLNAIEWCNEIMEIDVEAI